MNEMRDRCVPAVGAVYRAERHGELYLCRHCTNRLWTALFTQGWAIWPARRLLKKSVSDYYVSH
jgi:hypothetical protein